MLIYILAGSPVYAVGTPSYFRNHIRNPWQTKQSFFGAMGCSMAMVLSSLGAAYGIAKSGIGISAVSVMRPDMMVRSECFHTRGVQASANLVEK
jgi:hypothetical protein